MDEILHMRVDACTSAHRHGTVGKCSLPRIIVYRVCRGRFFYILPPPDCSDSNKMKQRIEFENKLFS